MALRVGWIGALALGSAVGVVAPDARACVLWPDDARVQALLDEIAPEVLLLGVVPLPAEPTVEEVAAHLQMIAEATEALPHAPQRGDPQVAMLEALATDYFDELVQAHERYPVLRYYLDPILHREIALRGGPDKERLSRISLSLDADEDAAWSYVLDVSRATMGQRRVSANDPQVEMLEALAASHMRVLIDAVDLTELRFYALLAIRRVVDETHKDTVIAALPDQPRLISVVRQHGWAEDARDQLVMGLERGVDYMPRTWVQVMVDLSDPLTYDALALHLVRMRCAGTYYRMMCDLPGIELDDAVCLAWERVSADPTGPRELREVSEIAVGHGHADALAHLVGLLQGDDAPATPYDVAVRGVVLRHIDFTGSNAQIKAWFEANRDRLVFSRQGRAFYAAGELQ